MKLKMILKTVWEMVIVWDECCWMARVMEIDVWMARVMVIDVWMARVMVIEIAAWTSSLGC